MSDKLLNFAGLGTVSRYILRKTGEVVEVIASFAAEPGARSEEDWVSYIDSNGGEHIKEALNLDFDFKPEDAWGDKMKEMLNLADIAHTDRWESRRYDMTFKFVSDGYDVKEAVHMADRIIYELKHRGTDVA